MVTVFLVSPLFAILDLIGKSLLPAFLTLPIVTIIPLALSPISFHADDSCFGQP
jgi:hypothetical protein